MKKKIILRRKTNLLRGKKKETKKEFLNLRKKAKS